MSAGVSETDHFVICRICGKRDLIWGGYLDHPYLVHPLTGVPHKCNPADVLLHAASDFKDCDE